MGQSIQIRRGNKVNLPTFQNGELGLAQDTQDVYVGTPNGNVMVGGASVVSSLAEKKNKTTIKRKAFITVIDDDGRAQWISNGHSAVLANHPNAKITLAINAGQIGTTDYLTWSDIDSFKNNPQYEIVNHGYMHQEPLNLTLEQLQSNYNLEKDTFIAHGLNNYDYFIYPGYTPPPTQPNQVSNADLKNRLRQVYKCCLMNTEADNSFIPFEAYEVRRTSAYAGNTTKDYIDYCIENNAWCVIFGHAWMNGQDSTTLDDILTYIDGKVSAGVVQYVNVKEMIDNYSNIIEVGNGTDGADYFILDKNGNVNFSIDGVSAIEMLKSYSVFKREYFNNDPISSYKANSKTIEPITYQSATSLGLPETGTIETVRIVNDNFFNGSDMYNFQRYTKFNSSETWVRYWDYNTSAWKPFVPVIDGLNQRTIVLKTSAFNNSVISTYTANKITIEYISYSEAVKYGLPETGIIETVRIQHADIWSGQDQYNYQKYTKFNSSETWIRHWDNTDGRWRPFIPVCGASASSATVRPRYSQVGASIFDTTLGKPIWCKTTGWNNNKTNQRNTSYNVGDTVLVSGGIYECTTAGTTGATEPAWSSSATALQDGSVVWDYVGTQSVWVDATGVTV